MAAATVDPMAAAAAGPVVAAAVDPVAAAAAGPVVAAAVDPVAAAAAGPVAAAAVAGTSRPVVVGERIPDRTLGVCEIETRNLAVSFSHRDREDLDYAVTVADADVAVARLEGESTLRIRGVARGSTTVAVTATDGGGASASATFGVTVRGPALVPLFPRAGDALGRQGFVRVINRSGAQGQVSVEAIDDSGVSAGTTHLLVPANAAVHFNSDDLERGNADKGLSRGVGVGQGDWWLLLDGAFDFEVLAYVRGADGFVTSMHDVAPGTYETRRVAILNPGSNTAQVSSLRLVNRCERDAEVSIVGVDDTGASPGTAVEVSVAGGETLTLPSADLEAGMGLEGALGDGEGKWRLELRSEEPVAAVSLLSSPTGHLTNLSTVEPMTLEDGVHIVPLFPSASDALGRQGFVRVVNRSEEAGVVRIEARDDSDASYETLTLALEAGQTMHFNSEDLELGNESKGLTGRTGPGVGVWRLALSSELDIEVLAYIRTAKGFVTSMHDMAPSDEGDYWVAIFNPGSNANQVGVLRLVNPGSEDAAVTIAGVDDAGESPGTRVGLRVPAGGARTLTAADLEAGMDVDRGALGDGAGKWRLTVTSDEPIVVMSLISSPAGHLTNLSSAPDR